MKNKNGNIRNIIYSDISMIIYGTSMIYYISMKHFGSDQQFVNWTEWPMDLDYFQLFNMVCSIASCNKFPEATRQLFSPKTKMGDDSADVKVVPPEL